MLIDLVDINAIIMIDWVNRGQMLKKQYYIEVLRRFRERATKKRHVEQQHRDFAPRQRLGAHCALCKTVLSREPHYCAPSVVT
ncbi:hypothetical protein TNCV_3900681 [Trichonephila clavipes]|nr:hypothetical protein TNCV_3900681 [Trichonephila clavipes]